MCRYFSRFEIPWRFRVAVASAPHFNLASAPREKFLFLSVWQNEFSPAVLSYEERIPRSTFYDNFNLLAEEPEKRAIPLPGDIEHDRAEKKRQLNSFETTAWRFLGLVLSFQDFYVFSHGRINARIMEKSFNLGDGDTRLVFSDTSCPENSRNTRVKCAFRNNNQAKQTSDKQITIVRYIW